jgi:leader peptidase (prepilin peptidase) / N-methyltransferase
MSGGSNAFAAQNNFLGSVRTPVIKPIRIFAVVFPTIPHQTSAVFLSKARMLADTGFLGFFAPLCLFGGVLALIDIRHGIIPDWLNLSIAGLGLAKVVIAGGSVAGIEAACEGAAVGLIFWLLRRLYFRLRKIQGLGLGDVKFLAAAGIWIGIAGLPILLLIAALTALAAAGIMQLAGRDMTRRTSVPFGPFLALGLLLTLVTQQFLGAT